MLDWVKIADRLRDLLDRDRESGSLPVSKLGMISRRHYAKVLSVPLTSLIRNCADVFNEYERYGAALIDRVRERLERDAASSSIVVGRTTGLINRGHYAKLVGITRKTLSVRCGDVFAPYEANFSLLVDKLRSILHRDEAEGRIITYKEGRIDQRHYAREIGVTKSWWKGHCREVVAEFQGRLVSPAKRLRALLDRDINSGEIQTSLDGMINRSHYAALLGISTTSITRQCNAVLVEYDAVLGKVPDRLRSILERDRNAGEIVKSRTSLVNRAHYAKVLGVSLSFVMNRCRAIFSEYEADWESVENKLRGLIERDSAAGTLVASRRGLISRTHYAKLIGVSQSLLGNSYREIFAEYETKYAISTGGMSKIGAIREYLEEAYTSGSLGYRNGKVDRKTCMEAMGYKDGGSIYRTPEIVGIFASYDLRARLEAYIPLDKRFALEKVETWLRKPVLKKDLRTINKKRLLADTGIEPRLLDEPKIADAISSREAKVLAKAQTSMSDPFLQGRVFPFGKLRALWSGTFIDRIGSRFKIAMSGLAAPKIPYLALYDALKWIGRDASPICKAVVADAKANGRITNEPNWVQALSYFREHLVGEAGGNPSARNNVMTRIKALRTALNAMQAGGVTPKLEKRLRNISMRGGRSGRHLRSVAELTPACSEGVQEGYLQFARARFDQACILVKSDMQKNERDDFIRGLGAELARQIRLPDTASEAVLVILNNRISALIDRAILSIEEARSRWAQGQKLLAEADIEPLDFERKYFAQQVSKEGRCARDELVRKYFPYPRDSGAAARKRSMANLFKLVRDRLGGALPSINDPIVGYGYFFRSRISELGGLEELDGILTPSLDACGAILTLYLAESGANVSVGRTLDRACVQPSDLDDHSRITGHKARAKGKPIFFDHPKESAVVVALEWMKEVSQPYASSAGSDQDRLFVVRCGGRIQLMPADWYTAWFKRFSDETPGLEGLEFVPRMIRPSVLLRAALSNDGRLQVGLAIAQHGIGEAKGYQNKWPTRLLYDDGVRRFQNDLETVIVRGIPEAAHRLGVSENEMRARLDQVASTGLGTFCLNLKNARGPRDRLCQTMSCWDCCPHMLIIAETEAIATLQLWQESLRAAAAEWERDRPERWEKVWLPWLCLVDVVQEKMSRGPLHKIWKAAMHRVTELRQSANFVAHTPW
ncbi:hypothetical protein [Tardiphaga robiniae]|uniref:hypothetical protein n=1 Tax=Tardiphaga robiniae TaxID=943830 RepID=UPI0015866B35|nr:hypothetical protein [Tardiphaga robiniae]NUU41859.1 hypothetical protein [Tardiphaga robiniae]